MNAAFRVAQHSINHPALMRECRSLIDASSQRGDVPREHFAYIDDRIRMYEGLPQRYGTQWRGGVGGLEPYPVDDWSAVDERRRALGLKSLDEMKPEWSEQLTQDDVDRHRAGELAWRRQAGWIE